MQVLSHKSCKVTNIITLGSQMHSLALCGILAIAKSLI